MRWDGTGRDGMLGRNDIRAKSNLSERIGHVVAVEVLDAICESEEACDKGTR